MWKMCLSLRLARIQLKDPCRNACANRLFRLCRLVVSNTFNNAVRIRGVFSLSLSFFFYRLYRRCTEIVFFLSTMAPLTVLHEILSVQMHD